MAVKSKNWIEWRRLISIKDKKGKVKKASLVKSEKSKYEKYIKAYFSLLKAVNPANYKGYSITKPNWVVNSSNPNSFDLVVNFTKSKPVARPGLTLAETTPTKDPPPPPKP